MGGGWRVEAHHEKRREKKFPWKLVIRTYVRTSRVRVGGWVVGAKGQAMNKLRELAFYIWAILNSVVGWKPGYELQLIIRKGCASSVRLINNPGGERERVKGVVLSIGGTRGRWPRGELSPPQHTEFAIAIKKKISSKLMVEKKNYNHHFEGLPIYPPGGRKKKNLNVFFFFFCLSLNVFKLIYNELCVYIVGG